MVACCRELDMDQRKRSRIVVTLLMLSAALTGGCETDFIEAQALESFASFLTSVVTTAVDEAIRP